MKVFDRWTETRLFWWAWRWPLPRWAVLDEVPTDKPNPWGVRYFRTVSKHWTRRSADRAVNPTARQVDDDPL